MEAHELRLGNLVKDGAIIYEVFSNERNAIHVVEYPFIPEVSQYTKKYFPSSLNPIPLTDEWLLKFGFEKQNDGSFEILNKIYFGLDYYDNDIHIMTQYQSEKLNIKHVHQLQNLYFVLTGEELELKEKAL